MEKINSRPFLPPPPSVIGWADAIGLAHGGIMCEIKPEYIGAHRPLMADNCLAKGKLCDLGDIRRKRKLVPNIPESTGFKY